MSTASALQSSILVNDRSEALVLGDERESSGLKESRMHHYVYVDNLGLMSVDQSSVEEGLKDVERVFESENLVLHPGLVSTGSTQALGCDLRGDLLASRVTPERYHKLRQAIGGLLARKNASGRLLEVVIGHATFVGLTCRPVLSLFNTV